MKSLPKDPVRNQPLSVRAELAAPSSAESPRPPRDYLIGILGAEGGSGAPYLAAASFLNDFSDEHPVERHLTRSGSVGFSDTRERLSLLGGAISVRVGSPASEGDGAVSYLIRLVGKDASLSGEIRMVSGSDGTWLVDFLALDLDDPLGGPSGFDPLSYNRFL